MSAQQKDPFQRLTLEVLSEHDEMEVSNLAWSVAQKYYQAALAVTLPHTKLMLKLFYLPHIILTHMGAIVVSQNLLSERNKAILLLEEQGFIMRRTKSDPRKHIYEYYYHITPKGRKRLAQLVPQ